ncbi:MULTISPECIES: flavin-containing monooxygenase [Pseudofrankia]|uniref:flavin-containing monooxygenase n=1 Tax=Pseudofrankia TaxID=2994363 RepID=UPI000234BD4F|nr:MULTISPECIES: NAD(P)/FAD-dependent oxidoreductase [Pseudofrankia]OHV38216.1 FAD-containing monooxygenase EthA [Pseudofrankia sp. EUN1h]
MQSPAEPAEMESLDVLIIGAGVSGIGAGRYLRTEHPAKSFAILEARASLGGTWDLFRYPGIRSDSDLHTFGYEFKPWLDKESIADAPRILDYLREAADENGLGPRIRYNHRVVRATWSSPTARWTVEAERRLTQDGPAERVSFRARWIFAATGYYRYDEGYTPVFEGRDRFAGEIVHPQTWPDDLDYAGRRVVVIGSGATAVTLVPALLRSEGAGAGAAAHVTLLQRTPTYILPVPRVDRTAIRLRKVFGERRGHALTRRKNIARQRLIWVFCQRYPAIARRVIRYLNRRALPPGFDLDTHFNPPYNPWDQRVCVAPNRDLYRALAAGKASMVTDQIASFTETGILLRSGEELPADIIVTATGLNIQVLGGAQLEVDGKPISFRETVVYRGLMLSGVPNLALAVGYTNSSWTLKISLLCEYFCRLLSHMDEHGFDTACAVADPEMATRPLLDFGAGYVQRALGSLPRQGPRAPWVMSSNYHDDRKLIRRGPIADEQLRFTRAAEGGATGSSANDTATDLRQEAGT